VKSCRSNTPPSLRPIFRSLRFLQCKLESQVSDYIDYFWIEGAFLGSKKRVKVISRRLPSVSVSMSKSVDAETGEC